MSLVMSIRQLFVSEYRVLIHWANENQNLKVPRVQNTIIGVVITICEISIHKNADKTQKQLFSPS